MARNMNIWPRTVEETATYKIVQDMPRDYAVYVCGRYVGSRADYASAYTLAIAETTAAAEAEAAAADTQALAAYNAEHAPYAIEYNADNGDYDVIYGNGEPWEVWLGSAPTYSDADAVIDAHIARIQAQERLQAEWSEQRHHGA